MNFKNKIKSIQLWCSALVIAAIAIIVISCSPDETQTVTNFNTLTLNEEFEGDELDSNLWSFEIGDGTAQGIPGWGNNESQYYTDRPENVVVEDGILKIIARQESFEGSNYTSARIITKGKFQQQYGRFEARIKLPWGQGIWPAFWMLGEQQNPLEIWPQIGEIDVMEYRGQEPTIVHGSLHGPGYSGANPITKSYELTNDRFDNDFHIFGVEWGPNYVNFYVDDVLYNQITPNNLNDDDVADDAYWVYNDREFYIILNMAVGGFFAGNPDPTLPYPQVMEVDYVKVYAAD